MQLLRTDKAQFGRVTEEKYREKLATTMAISNWGDSDKSKIKT